MIQIMLSPDMKLGDFMMTPYVHDGVCHDQTFWIQDLTVGAERIGAPLRPLASR